MKFLTSIPSMGQIEGGFKALGRKAGILPKRKFAPPH